MLENIKAVPRNVSIPVSCLVVKGTTPTSAHLLAVDEAKADEIYLFCLVGHPQNIWKGNVRLRSGELPGLPNCSAK